VPGRRLLAEALVARLPFWDRAYVVDPAWHAAISTNPRLQFMEFFAKNVAARRSKADAVLTTNSDVFLSEALVARLAAAPLEDEHVYRAVRHDVDRHCDWRRGGEGVLANPKHHLRVNQLTAPEFSNAAGDFLLLTTPTFQRLRGFNETVRYAKIHKDGQFCHRAWIEGLTFETLGPIWHLDHDGSYSNVGVLHGAPDAPYGPEWAWRDTYRNPASWGVSAAVEESTGGAITWLRVPATGAVVAAHAAAASDAPAIDPEALARATTSTLADGPRTVAAWIAALGLAPASTVAIVGPDWATPWIASALAAAGHLIAGLYTPDARVVGSIRCGYVARALDTVAGAGADAIVSGWADPAVEARVRRAGVNGSVHGLAPIPEDALPPELPSELAMLLQAQRAEAAIADGQAGDPAERAARFAALSTLAGPARHVHAYEAALAWERCGRPDEAVRTFAQVLAAEDGEPVLRGRARFHLGRLCYERGEFEAARKHLGEVLRETPDHRRARGYLEAIDRAGGGGGAA
jgi:hypothetical protein